MILLSSVKDVISASIFTLSTLGGGKVNSNVLQDSLCLESEFLELFQKPH